MVKEAIPQAFQELEDEFERRGQGCQVHEGYFLVAGHRVRFRWLDPRLGSTLLRPLQHLGLTDEGPPALEVELLEQPASQDLSSVFFDYSADRNQAVQILPRSMSVWRSRPAKIVARYQPVEQLSLYELGRPLHAMLSLWCNQIGAPLIHAGLVECRGVGVLVGGDGGRGKTTTCLSCLESGAPFLGDDLACLDADLRGHSLFATTFLREDRRRQCDFLGSEWLPIRYPWEEKCLTYLYPQQSRLLRSSVVVKALVLPSPTGVRERISPIKALKRLAPSSLLVGPLSAGQAGLERLVRLVESVPCFALPWAENMARQLEQLLSAKEEA